MNTPAAILGGILLCLLLWTRVIEIVVIKLRRRLKVGLASSAGRIEEKATGSTLTADFFVAAAIVVIAVNILGASIITASLVVILVYIELMPAIRSRRRFRRLTSGEASASEYLLTPESAVILHITALFLDDDGIFGETVLSDLHADGRDRRAAKGSIVRLGPEIEEALLLADSPLGPFLRRTGSPVGEIFRPIHEEDGWKVGRAWWREK